MNTLAYKLIDEGPVQSSQVTWENLSFEEFGLQPICVLTEQIKSTTLSELSAELLPRSEAQAHESMNDLTDSGELFQSSSAHSESEPIPIPTTCAFESPVDPDEFEKD